MTFDICGVTYKAVPIDFNTVCALEDYGVSLTDAGSKNLMLIRAYVAVCAGVTPNEAGKMIEQHIVDGGDLESITAAFQKMVGESGFFQALKQRTAATEEAEAKVTAPAHKKAK